MTTFESKTGTYQLRSVSYKVASLTTPDTFYDVTVTDDGWSCTCADHVYRRRQCKHIGMARQGKVDSKPHARIMPLPTTDRTRERDMALVAAMYQG